MGILYENSDGPRGKAPERTKKQTAVPSSAARWKVQFRGNRQICDVQISTVFQVSGKLKTLKRKYQKHMENVILCTFRIYICMFAFINIIAVDMNKWDSCCLFQEKVWK